MTDALLDSLVKKMRAGQWARLERRQGIMPGPKLVGRTMQSHSMCLLTMQAAEKDTYSGSRSEQGWQSSCSQGRQQGCCSWGVGPASKPSALLNPHRAKAVLGTTAAALANSRSAAVVGTAGQCLT